MARLIAHKKNGHCKALCGSKDVAVLAITWNAVTCKVCLKMKPKLKRRKIRHKTILRRRKS